VSDHSPPPPGDPRAAQGHAGSRRSETGRSSVAARRRRADGLPCHRASAALSSRPRAAELLGRLHNAARSGTWPRQAEAIRTLAAQNSLLGAKLHLLEAARDLKELAAGEEC
jgi:hypothetical protein